MPKRRDPEHRDALNPPMPGSRRLSAPRLRPKTIVLAVGITLNLLLAAVVTCSLIG